MSIPPNDLTVLLPLSILAVKINTISGTNMSQMLMQIKAEPFPELLLFQLLQNITLTSLEGFSDA